MGSDSKTTGPPKFQFYNSETGELLGRNGASWRKYISFGFVTKRVDYMTVIIAALIL